MALYHKQIPHQDRRLIDALIESHEGRLIDALIQG
jgi:hypothetical protein